MEKMGGILDAINLIDVKKENLRRSFLQLQSQSPSSFNYTFKWTDIDSYFTTLRSSLNRKFHLLQTLCPSSVVARPQLKSFCKNSDGLGLRRFIILASDRVTISSELPDAYRCAPDAAAMVLDAMEGFYGGNGAESRSLKRSCVTMLEGLMHLKPIVTHELMDKAMLVALQWNRKRVSGPVKDREQNALGFLLLVGAYGLIDRFSMDELLDCFVIASIKRHTFQLCRQMIQANKISDLIQKLINKQMLVVAVKCSIEFQKTDEFSPVGLLEECKLISERTIEEIRKNMKSHHVCNKETLKEVNTLKSIIRCIDEYHLESEYLKDTVVGLVKKLEDEMGSRKRKKLENGVGIRKRGKKKNKLLVPKTIQNVVVHQQPHILPASPAFSAPYAALIPMPDAGSTFYIPYESHSSYHSQ